MVRKKTINMDIVQQYISDGIDLSARLIDFADGVNGDTVRKAVRAIRVLQSISKKPIIISVSSPGGDIYDTLRLYDAIRDCSCPIVTVAEGAVMSGGSFIYLAGDKRVAMPNATFMLHQYNSHNSGTHEEQRVSLAEGERLMNVLAGIYHTRTGYKSLMWWRKFIQHEDRYLDVTQAVEMGLINARAGE